MVEKTQKELANQESALAPGSEGAAHEAVLISFFHSLVQCLAQFPTTVVSNEGISSEIATGDMKAVVKRPAA